MVSDVLVRDDGALESKARPMIDDSDNSKPPPNAKTGPLGYAPMDDIHAEFDALLVKARAGEPANWVTILAEIQAHLTMHFEAEDRWMQESQYPSDDCHSDEHAAVLASANQVLALAREGKFDAAPSFIEALVNWFPGHATYLDSALAAWLCKQKFGGKPLVFHRRASASGSAAV